MRTQVLVLLIVVAAGCLWASSAFGVAGKPRCAIKNPVPDITQIFGRGKSGDSWIGGEFHNRCLDAVRSMGTFACLEEMDHPFSPPHVVECFVNEDRPVLIAPHTTSVYMAAHCRWTSIRRWYQISGYGWAIALESLPYRSVRASSRAWTTPPTGSIGKNLKCDIRKGDVKWRDEPWWP